MERFFRFIYGLIFVISIPFTFFINIRFGIGYGLAILISELLSFIGDSFLKQGILLQDPQLKIKKFDHYLFGILFLILALILYSLNQNQWIFFFIGLGLGLILHDLIYHFLIYLFPHLDESYRNRIIAKKKEYYYFKF